MNTFHEGNKETSILEDWLPRFSGKESICQAVDAGLIPGLGISPGGGNGNPVQYSCLGNLMDRGTWWATVHGVAKNRTRLSNQIAAATLKNYKIL